MTSFHRLWDVIRGTHQSKCESYFVMELMHWSTCYIISTERYINKLLYILDSYCSTYILCLQFKENSRLSLSKYLSRTCKEMFLSRPDFKNELCILFLFQKWRTFLPRTLKRLWGIVFTHGVRGGQTGGLQEYLVWTRSKGRRKGPLKILIIS